MIKINKDWGLESDEICVTLFKLRKGKDKKGRQVAGYYPNFKAALIAMVDKEIQNLESLEYMCRKLDSLKSQISKIQALSPKSTGVKKKKKG